MRDLSILKSNKFQGDEISIFNLPKYLEMGFSIFSSQIDSADPEEARWNFLLWVYEDESNLIFKDARQDEYVQNLLSKPYFIKTSEVESVEMHMYHYWYFKKENSYLTQLGFLGLLKDPKSYLLWFYESLNKVNHYSASTRDGFYFKPTINQGQPSIFSLPLYVETKFLKLQKDLLALVMGGETGKIKGDPMYWEEKIRWIFLNWAYSDDKNSLNFEKDIRSDEYILKLLTLSPEYAGREDVK